MFTLSINLILNLILIISALLIIINFDKIIINEFYKHLIENLNKENIANLIKLFNYPTNFITILLMNYLLITLIAIVKITNIFYGPLRQIFN